MHQRQRPIFVYEVGLQSQLVLYAAQHLDEAIAWLHSEPSPVSREQWSDPAVRSALAHHSKHAVPRIWYGIQGVLIPAANLSKLFWGSRGKRTVERGELRRMFQVEDSSPLHLVDVRSDFEHIDERIEQWLPEEPGSYFGRNINFEQTAGDDKHYGHYNEATGVVTFWNNEASIPNIVAEATRLEALARDLLMTAVQSLGR